jgi:hypothetical protein
MDIRGVHYTWAPNDNNIEVRIFSLIFDVMDRFADDVFQLIASGSSNAILLARVTRGSGVISLEVTPDAIQLGILDSIVTATFLLQSGRNVD